MIIPPTFSRVAISTTAAGKIGVLATQSSGKVPRLHSLHIRAVGAGTVRIETAPSATGSSTAFSALAGAMPVAANGELEIQFIPQIEGCLSGTVSYNLQVRSTGTTLKGYGVVSQSTHS